jgi:hypothetical protein
VKILTITGEAARKAACREILAAPEGWVVRIGEPTRTLAANGAMWPILEAFARQLEWPINGMLQKITAEDWKDILSAAFRRAQPRVAQGVDGGMVLLGQRTREFSKREFSDWLEFLHATAADRGVEL